MCHVIFGDPKYNEQWFVKQKLKILKIRPLPKILNHNFKIFYWQQKINKGGIH